MPTISFFYGIVIQMYWRDHTPRSWTSSWSLVFQACFHLVWSAKLAKRLWSRCHRAAYGIGKVRFAYRFRGCV